MKVKKVSALCLSMVLGFVLTACNGGSTGSSSDSEVSSTSEIVGNSAVKTEVLNAVEALKNKEEIFLVSTEMSLPESQLYYIEIIDNEAGNAWTEYPVDEDGNLGTVSFLEADNTQYQIFDWWTKEGMAYTFQTNVDTEGNGMWVEMPTIYGEALNTRNSLYLDVLTENAYDYNEGTSSTLEDGSTIKLYTCRVPSESVAKVMGLDSLTIYEGLYADAEANGDKDSMELCQHYIDELEMNLTYSEGLLTIQFIDDKITGMSLEAGGLGTRMYVTKTIAAEGEGIEKRETPNFEGAAKYYDTLKELAEYVAQYGSYEEAMIELNKTQSGLSQEVEELEGTEGTLPVEETTNSESTETTVSE